jgi:hypothetical protein
MNKIQKLVKESIQGYKTKESCSCGCNTCEDSRPLAPILNESIAPRAILSEGLKYHIDTKKPLTEHVYRAGSENYFNLWAEARSLYSRGILEIQNQDDLEILNETNLGEFGIIYEIEIGDKVKASKEYGGLSGEVVDIRGSFIVVKTKEGNQSYHESDLKVLNREGKKVPLDFIMEDEYLDLNEDFKIGDIIQVNPKAFPNFEFPYGTEGEISDINKADYASDDLVYTVKIKYIDGQGDESNILHVEDSNQYLTESKNENKPIGKPMRDSSGGKAYKVYVKDPKTKKIKTVRFGSGGLKAKINNPKARKAFAKRHNCAQKTDRTKASYWSCRLPRYSKLLGLKSNFSGFW